MLSIVAIFVRSVRDSVRGVVGNVLQYWFGSVETCDSSVMRFKFVFVFDFVARGALWYVS